MGEETEALLKRRRVQDGRRGSSRTSEAAQCGFVFGLDERELVS